MNRDDKEVRKGNRRETKHSRSRMKKLSTNVPAIFMALTLSLISAITSAEAGQAGAEARQIIQAKDEAKIAAKPGPDSPDEPKTPPAPGRKAVETVRRGPFDFEAAKRQFAKGGQDMKEKDLSGTWKITAAASDDDKVGRWDEDGIGEQQMEFAFWRNPLTPEEQSIGLKTNLGPNIGPGSKGRTQTPVSLGSRSVKFSLGYKRDMTYAKMVMKRSWGDYWYEHHRPHELHEDRWDYECLLVDPGHLLCKEQELLWKEVPVYREELPVNQHETRIVLMRRTAFLGFARGVPRVETGDVDKRD